MSFFFGPKGGKVKPQYTGLQLQTSSSTQAITLVWGGNRVGPNLVWYDDFKSHKKKQKAGKGGGSQTTYTYSASVILGLCEGPIIGVGKTFKDSEKIASYSSLGMSLFTGTYPQSPWGYLTSAHPDAALAYSGLAYLAVANYDLGQSASLPNHSFEVFGPEYDTAPLGHDADCADVIYDFLTNFNYGVLFPVANIDVDQLFSTVDAPTTGDSSYQTYCTAMGFGLSPALADPTRAGDILSRWARLTNSEVVWDGHKLRIIPYARETVSGNGVTYLPPQLSAPAYSLTDEDLLSEFLGSRVDPADCPNILSLEINNRFNEYNKFPVEWRDQSLIDQFGERKANAIDATEVTDPDMAMTMVTLIGQRGAYIRNIYDFSLGQEYVELEPMDTLLVLNAAGSQVLVQISTVEEQEDNSFKITAEEISATVGSSGTGAVQPATPTIINTGVLASPVNPPIIFEPSADLTGGVAQVWAAVSGGDGTDVDPYWGGAVVYISTDDITYQAVGVIDSSARQGKLTSTLAAPTGSYPEAVTFDVDLSMSGGELQGVTAQEAEDEATLAYVGGELISYTGATLTTVYNYELDDLWRALHGSTGGSHAIGEDFARLDENVFRYNLPAEYVGVPLYFKFQSFNIWNQGYQDLSSCVAYPYTPDGNGFAVAPPSSVNLAFSVTAQADGANIIRGTITVGASAGPLLSHYDVEYSPDNGVTWVSGPSIPAGGTQAIFEPAIPLTDYKARAKAVSTAVEGIPSAWVTTGTVNSGNLSTVAPGPVSTVAAIGGALSVLVTWNPPVTGGAPSGYKIYAVNNHTDPFGSAVLVGTVTGAATLQFTHVGLTADSPWRYWVTAFNFAGESSEDGPADATTTSAGGGGALEIQEAGVTKLAAATILNFLSGATIVDGGSGEAEISISGGGGGGGSDSGWVLLQAWDFAVDGAVANIDVPTVDVTDIAIIGRGVTRSVSGLDAVLFSVNGGASFYSGASDYEYDTGAGTNATLAYMQFINTAGASTGARSYSATFHGLNVDGAPKLSGGYILSSGFARYRFAASLLPVNAIRIYNTGAGNFTGGAIYILGKKRSTGSKPWYFDPPIAADFTLATGSGTADLTLVDDADVGLLINDLNAPTAGDDWRLAYKTLPVASDWQVTMRAEFTAPNINWSQSGFGIWDSVGGRIESFEYLSGSGNSAYRVCDYTAINGTFAASLISIEHRMMIPTWRRMTYTLSTNTIDYQISMDGKNWITLLSRVVTTYLANVPDRIFFGYAYNRTTGFNTTGYCDHWEQSW